MTLSIRGARFSPGDDVLLERASDGVAIPARHVRVIDSTRIEANLLMDGAAHGSWDVIVTTTGRDPARSEDAVVVEDAVPPVLTVIEPDPAALRPGATAGTLSFEVFNAGNVDADHVFLLGLVEVGPGREILGIAARGATLGVAARGGFSRTSALFSRVAPGELARATVTARAGADLPADATDLPVGLSATIVSAEKLIELELAAAEAARRAVLRNPELVSPGERASTLARAEHRDDWRDHWFAALVASGVVLEEDVLDFAAPAPPVAGTARCLDRTQVGRETPEYCDALDELACDELSARALEIGAGALGVFDVPPDADGAGIFCALEELVSCSFCTLWPVKRSNDPNEKTGGEGTGDEGLVPRDKKITYRIHFENKASADAPAALVEIRDPLDAAINPGSFRAGDISFGSTRIDVPDDVAFFQQRVEVSGSDGLLVEITAGVDARRSEAFWIFQTLDQDTGLPPSDANRGFLPPTDESGRGLGWVEFTVRPKPRVKGKIRIKNEARIRFDDNETIVTNAVENTVDGDVPLTAVRALPETVTTPRFEVSWAAEGDSPDVASYTIFVSVDGGPFAPWLVNTTATTADFDGAAGSAYEFYSVAVDHAGNEEPPPELADASTFVQGAEAFFLRGDANGDGGVDISDPTAILNTLFLGGAEPACVDAADANDDGDVNISDAIFALGFLFLGGSEPDAPGIRDCGPDPTDDPLADCEDPDGVCE